MKSATFFLTCCLLLTALLFSQCAKITSITSPDVINSPMEITATLMNVSNVGASDGSITISVKGGTAPYSFLWSTGAITKDLIDCPAGVYSIQVTDSKNSIVTKTFSLTVIQPPDIPIKVLFIGNSLTGFNNTPMLFKMLADTNNKKVDIHSHLIYGPTFRTYYQSPEFDSILNEQQWDYIFLQSDDIMAFEEFRTTEITIVNTIKTKALLNNDKTKILYFMCWTMLGGFDRYDYEALYEHILDGMNSMVNQCDIGIVPIGMAWYLTLDSVRRNDLYANDGWHPTETGSYLFACVLYSAIFLESVENTSFYSTISETDARYFQKLGSKTVIDNLALWNL